MEAMWYFIKKMLWKKIPIWITFVALAAVIVFMLYPRKTVLKTNENNQETELFSSIKKLEKVHELVLLNTGIQKVETVKNDTKLFGNKIPASEKKAIIILSYTAKFGITKNVDISETSEHHYKVKLPKYEVIGTEQDNGYKLYSKNEGFLSFSTKDVDTGEAISKALSKKEQESYLKDYTSMIDESAENYYDNLIKSIDSEATVEVISNSGK